MTIWEKISAEDLADLRLRMRDDPMVFMLVEEIRRLEHVVDSLSPSFVHSDGRVSTLLD